MEEPRVSKTQESTYTKKQIEDDAALTKRESYTGNLSHLEWRSMQTSTVML